MEREDVAKELRMVRDTITCNEAYMERLRRNAKMLVEMLDRTDPVCGVPGAEFTDADEQAVINAYWG